MSFEKKKKIGKLGERATKNFYKQRKKDLLDVSEIKDWQEVDVDFLESKTLEKIETKTDTNPARNILVEHIENIYKNRAGWLHRSLCDTLSIYKAQTKDLILLNFPLLKKHCIKHLKNKTAEILTPKKYPQTRNICLNIDTLIILGIVIGMYTLTNEGWQVSDYFSSLHQQLLYLSQ